MSGYSWREVLDENGASPTPGAAVGTTWLPSSPNPSMFQGALLQLALIQLLHTLGEPIIHRDQEPITHAVALPIAQGIQPSWISDTLTALCMGLHH